VVSPVFSITREFRDDFCQLFIFITDRATIITTTSWIINRKLVQAMVVRLHEFFPVTDTEAWHAVFYYRNSVVTGVGEFFDVNHFILDVLE